MSRDIPPAIVRDYDDTDSDVDVLSTPCDRVSFRRGFGDTGYRVQVVEHDCPACNFGAMTRRWDVNSEVGDEVRYWCLNPNCKHYLSDQMSHAFSRGFANTPVVVGGL